MSLANRQQLSVRFADLRQLAVTVPAYVADKVGVEDLPGLMTTIEDDLGMAGLDTESLLLEFAETYRVDLTQFNFTGFISPEGMERDVLFLFLPKIVLWLLAWLMKLLLTVLCWPFSRALARKIRALPTLTFWLPASFPNQKRPSTEVLTVGDFVASAAVGHFVKREQVQLVLHRATSN